MSELKAKSVETLLQEYADRDHECEGVWTVNDEEWFKSALASVVLWAAEECLPEEPYGLGVKVVTYRENLLSLAKKISE